jgi:hypothetical protein
MIYKFIIEKEGLTFDCEQVVTGKGALKQMIHIAGVGRKVDNVVYGASKHSAAIMTNAARRIALEIINDI